MLYDCKSIKDIEPLSLETYVPDGNTALFDAIGNTIDYVGSRLDNTNEDEKPERLLFVIYTDGFENASTKYSREKVKFMIEHQRDKYNWEFIFLGCEENTYLVAESLGINNSVRCVFTAQGMADTYSTLNKSITSYRTTGVVDKLPNEIK